jgi:uncharacterized protein HemY
LRTHSGTLCFPIAAAEAWLLRARLDLRDNRTQEASAKVESALQLEPSNTGALALRQAIAAKRARKAPPLPQP